MDSTFRIRITAFQIADALNIKAIRAAYAGNLVAATPQELFYGPPEALTRDPLPGPANPYLYVLNYGVAVMAGQDDVQLSSLLAWLSAHASNPLPSRLKEEFDIHGPARNLRFGYNDLHVPAFSAGLLRIAMLNVAQSVALDYYDNLTDELLKEPNYFTSELERYGKLKTSRRKLLKYIGRTLKIKNLIVDNLYILDEPDLTWEDEYLGRVDKGLKGTFDIRNRFRYLDYELQEIRGNLELFSELLQHRQSNMLEFTIAVLVLVEVLNIFLDKLW